MEKKGIGFRIVRNSPDSLVKQVVVGLRQAIRCGWYAAGERLPSTRTLAEELGVSRIVTRAAMRQLAEAGLISSRVGQGAVALETREAKWRGRVLAIVPIGFEGLFQDILIGEISSCLSREGYLFSQLSVPCDGRGQFDFSQLDFILAQGVELACVFHNFPTILRHLDRMHIPYAEVMNGIPASGKSVGGAWLNFNRANGEFVEGCRRAGIRTALQIEWCDGMCDAVDALEGAGIRTKRMRLPIDYGEGRMMGARQAALKAFLTLRKLPDLLFFNDDNLAVGALPALMSRGIRIPEDVSVVTWANRFHLPIYTKELTRMEMDPSDSARIVSLAVMEYLKTGSFPAGKSFGPVWKEGGTLCRRGDE